MKILFVCRANSGRSQMAEAMFNGMTKKHHATSAGTYVTKKGRLPEHVINCLKDIGYDISTKRRTQLKRTIAENADKIIVMMEPHEVENFAQRYIKNSNKTEYWSIKDAKGTDYKFHCATRDKIKQKVRSLIFDLDKR